MVMGLLLAGDFLALRDWQDCLNVARMPETAITVGMAADVVADLIAKGAADDRA